VLAWMHGDTCTRRTTRAAIPFKRPLKGII